MFVTLVDEVSFVFDKDGETTCMVWFVCDIWELTNGSRAWTKQEVWQQR